MKAFMKIALIFICICMITSQNKQSEDKEIAQVYNEMVLRMAEGQTSDTAGIVMNQIFLWTSIFLFVILYFSVMAMIDMPIQKSSILYAKYGTTKSQQELR